MGVTTDRRSIVRYVDGHGDPRADAIAVESPVTIMLDDEVLVTTMRTPGHDLDLAAGWLVNESAVRQPADIARMAAFSSASDDDVDTIRVHLAEGVRPPRPRAFVTTSACGVCSADILSGVAAPDAPLHSPEWRVGAEQVAPLLATMREQQRMFDLTGALHAAALAAADGSLVCVREDVGRHNAVDKVVGHAVLQSMLPLTDHLLLVSGRVSYEVVHKALTAGVAGIAAVSGPTTLAIDLARRFDLVLIGFARDSRLNVYSGADRVTGGSAP